MMAFGLLPILVIFAAAFAVRTIAMTVFVPPRISREPVCEVCRYRVAGLSTFQCPECGTDLRLTGIITLPMEVKRRGSMSGAIISWIFLMFLAGGVGTIALSMLWVGPMMSSAASNSMTTTTPLTPASGAYTRIDVTSTVSYGRGMPSGTELYSLVKSDGSTCTLTFAPLGASYTVTDATGAATTTPNDGKGPDALFAAAGLNLADPKIGAEMREVATINGVLSATPYTAVSTIRMRALTPGPPSVSGSPGFTASAPSTPFMALYLIGSILWILLLAGGIVFIVLRRKKLLRQHVTERAAPPTDAPSA
jgi:hypothetical protein